MRSDRRIGLNILLAVILGLAGHCYGGTCESAKRWGFICLSATELAVCGTHDGITFLALDSEICPSGTYCNEDHRNCSSTPSLKSSYAEIFTCPSEGFYPNLGNCGKFIYCSSAGADPVSIDCPPGKMYSTKQGCCTDTLTEASCERRLISCETQGQVGAWPEDNRYFYYCSKVPPPYSMVYPHLMKCGENEVFSNDRCVLQTATTAATTTLPQKCTPGTFFRDSQDCRWYSYCDSDRVLKKYWCGSYAYFDTGKNRCLVGNC
ncbi:uncharacterized protein LOC119648317 [Hermetia illucens]|uniref:uncharacterized protein LOC119648317 n=1 Tax=Hermetia illucens TaxID=343691 RepID=UPI0018CC423E|nr:uncharacterized protein LOC119648317 [Hermetia illucens]